MLTREMLQCVLVECEERLALASDALERERVRDAAREARTLVRLEQQRLFDAFSVYSLNQLQRHAW